MVSNAGQSLVLVVLEAAHAVVSEKRRGACRKASTLMVSEMSLNVGISAVGKNSPCISICNVCMDIPNNILLQPWSRRLR